jgi:hypothetical protein
MLDTIGVKSLGWVVLASGTMASQILGEILTKGKQRSRWIVAGCLAGSLLLPVSVPAFAEGEDALQSVSRIAPEVLSNRAPAHETEVTNEELRVRTASADADIPLDSSNQVRIADSGTEIKIGLPFSEKSVKGHRQSNEPVQFDNGNGTSTIPVVKDDGSVQITTVIENAKSPQAFRYDLELPSGFSLRPNADGSVSFVDSSGKAAGGVAAPWAKDSRGAAVPTTYEISGTSLTQIVAHRGRKKLHIPWWRIRGWVFR